VVPTHGALRQRTGMCVRWYTSIYRTDVSSSLLVGGCGSGLLISGSKVRVLDGPPPASAGESGISRPSRVPDSASCVCQHVPKSRGSARRERVSSTGRSALARRLEPLDPRPIPGGNPVRAPRERGRGARVTHLRGDIRHRSAVREEMARERVAEVIEPAPRQPRAVRRAQPTRCDARWLTLPGPALARRDRPAG
jgi:hypothetical protein